MNRSHVAGLFLLSRLFLLAVGAAYQRLAGAQESIASSFCRWDCNWYLGLARQGYDLAPHAHPAGDAANWAFFPLYPLLFGTLAEGSGLSYLVAGYLVSNGCFLLALIMFHEYCQNTLDQGEAWWATVFLAFSPYSVYFMTLYTESLFLLLSVLVFYFADREKWVPAGMAAALLTATRATGLLIVPVLAYMILRRYRWRGVLALRGPAASALLSVAVAPLGLALFMAYLHGHMGDALAFSHVQVAWKRELGNPLRVLLDGILSFRPGHWAFVLVTLAGFAVAMVLSWFRRTAEAIFMAGGILLPLSTALFAMPRYIAGIFPAYIAASLMLRIRPSLRWYVLLLCIGLNVILVAAWMQKRTFMV